MNYFKVPMCLFKRNVTLQCKPRRCMHIFEERHIGPVGILCAYLCRSIVVAAINHEKSRWHSRLI
ncbi:hypothetical protein ARTHRO8AJ_90026 [Arthrobacter sp. 8AJ]|nr:hypothetical protein ARTHRO8AJ_90026 [Arthrobacter sp. 8AJ]